MTKYFKPFAQVLLRSSLTAPSLILMNRVFESTRDSILACGFGSADAINSVGACCSETVKMSVVKESRTQLQRLKVADLRKRLSSLGLSTDGMFMFMFMFIVALVLRAKLILTCRTNAV